MRYHLYKQSHVYEGYPYCGPTSNNNPAEADVLEEAKALAMEFAACGHVGWDIYDSTTGELVYPKEEV